MRQTPDRKDIVSSSGRIIYVMKCPRRGRRRRNRPKSSMSAGGSLRICHDHTSPSNRRILKLFPFIFSCGELGKQLKQLPIEYMRSRNAEAIARVEA